MLVIELAIAYQLRINGYSSVRYSRSPVVGLVISYDDRRTGCAQLFRWGIWIPYMHTFTKGLQLYLWDQKDSCLIALTVEVTRSNHIVHM